MTLSTIIAVYDRRTALEMSARTCAEIVYHKIRGKW